MVNYGKLFSVVIYLCFFCVAIIRMAKRKNDAKKANGGNTVVRSASSMEHTHREAGYHDTYNKKTRYNTAGAQPHVHETRKYRSMADASQLPKGYILLNGEPVRVADLEGK